MKFDIMVRPLEVLVVVVVDHLQVEREVGSVPQPAALLVVMFVVLPLVYAVLQLLLDLLHLVSHSLDLEKVFGVTACRLKASLLTSISRLSLYCCLLSLH